MKWIEIQVCLQKQGSEIVSILLQNLGSKGVWIEDQEEHVALKSYLSELDNHQVYLNRLHCELQKLEERDDTLGPITVQVQEVDDESWAQEWKKYYEPMRITERFTIKPLWKEYSGSNEEHIIHLDPGMAFGTGTHPTTILAVRLLERYVVPETQFLDVGCGSGILSVVSTKLGAKNGLAVDIDPVALDKTRENLGYNQVEGQVEVRKGDLLKGIDQQFDVVIANILAEVIIKMIEELPKVLKQDGIFICSGVIADKENQVIEALRGYRLLDKITMESWVAMVFKRC